MSLPKSPFESPTSLPGHGEIVLSILPPGRQVLTKLTYQYPLKLIAPDPHLSNNSHVTVAFLLTYGGGLIGGDKISLSVSLAESTKLALLTQGSTKIFKAPDRGVVSGQLLNITIGRGASLCYLPDPTQPFAESAYEQRQNFFVNPSSSLCVLDWVSEGRKARGESWHLWMWKGKNEVREAPAQLGQQGRLLLRDAMILSDDDLGGTGGSLGEKTDNFGVCGTLIIYGPMFAALATFFMAEFTNQPKLGNKGWKKDHDKSEAERKGELKQAHERSEGLLWTAAHVTGFVLVKFGSREIDSARRWLGGMLRLEGSVEREFGQQALLCLR